MSETERVEQGQEGRRGEGEGGVGVKKARGR